MKPTFSVLLGAAAAAAVLLTASPASAQTPCAGSDTAMTANPTLARSALVCMINNERVARGAAPLGVDPALDAASQTHADDMVARNYRSHLAPAPAPLGTTAADRAYGAGYPAANNLIDGWVAWNRTDTPRGMMTFFLRRGGECASMADPAFSAIGVGVAVAADGARLFVTFGGAGARTTQTPSCPSNVQATPLGGQTPAQQLAAAQTFARQSPGQVASQLGFPSAKQCRSRRSFTIRIKEPVPLRSATITYGGNRFVTRRIGGRLRAQVDLRGYTKGTVVVRITARTAAGVTAKGMRKYKTCSSRSL